VNSALATAACCLLLLPVLVIGAALGGSDQTEASQPAAVAVAGIPADFLALYQQAGTAYGIPWELLAGVGKVECDNGQSTDPACWEEGVTNSAGAGGPMQFLASTWAEYGVDANGDGVADRWDPADAIYGAANYLKASGAPADTPDAVYAYNHSWAYVNEVISYANQYSQQATTTNTPAAGTGPTGVATATAAVSYALAQIGTPYQWGAETPGVAFDCSGLTQAAYQAAGITLPRTAQAQYDASPPIPAGQPLQPGDLVFFGTSTTNITHVGLLVSPTEMVDAPHTGAVVRVEPYDWTDYLGATRPAA